jgi:hypothetical protein
LFYQRAQEVAFHLAQARRRLLAIETIPQRADV